MKKRFFSVLGIVLIGAVTLTVSCTKDEVFNAPLFKGVDVESAGGDALVFSAEVIDDNGIQTVEVYYKVGDAADFTAKALVKGEGDHYSAEVSGLGSDVMVYYYYKAVNVKALETFEPKDAPTTTFQYEMGGVDYKALVLNEIWAGGPTDAEKFVELYNKSNYDLDISDVWFERDEDGEVGRVPEGTILKAGAYYILGTKNNTENPNDPNDPYDNSISKGFSAKKSVRFIVWDPLGNEIDRFERGDMDALGGGISDLAPGSFCRIPNGTGDWKVVDNATLRAENDPTGAEDIPNV